MQKPNQVNEFCQETIAYTLLSPANKVAER